MKSKKITIFMSSKCSYCHREIEWLNQHSIPFESKDISKNEEYRKEFNDFNVQGVPYTVVEFENQERVSVLGFNKQRLANIIFEGWE